MKPHILKIEVIADSHLGAIAYGMSILRGMLEGTSSVNSHGPDGNMFGEIKPWTQGQKSLAKITHDCMGQRVKVEYDTPPPHWASVGYPEKSNGAGDPDFDLAPPFGPHIPHPVTDEEAGL